jgi:NAD(P)-dependent dehydrogenase (short-subunit alcohol dehydrogenase family)
MTQDVLAGRNALVTGASRGIGRAIAEAFAAAGAQVMISSRKADALRQVAKEAAERGLPGRIEWQVAHAGKPEDAQGCVAETVRRFGSVDILVNNAATNPYFGDLAGLDLPRAEKTIQVNQLGVLTWAQQAWHASMREHGGVIINISSVGAMMAEPGIGFYNVTKAAVLQLTRQLAYEMARADQDRLGSRSVGGPGDRASPADPAAAPRGDRRHRQRRGVPGLRRRVLDHRAHADRGRRRHGRAAR